ncbi:MAG: primosomal protein N' [Planctomycetota bacterium]|nr:primosomal protein N' [Planctomycetota bacterium]
MAPERKIDRYPEGLTYSIPQGMDLLPGMRVRCPLARQHTPVDGWVISVGGRELLDGLDPGRLRSIDSIDPRACHLPPSVAALGAWVAAYYCCPVGTTLASMVPAAVRKGIGMRAVYEVQLAVHPHEVPRGLSPKQRRIVEALEARGDSRGPLGMEQLQLDAGLATKAPIESLAKRGIVRLVERSAVHAKWREHSLPGSAEELELSPQQRSVVDSIGAALGSGFSTHLLHGVTGSGKTEVYLRLIRRALEDGKTTLVLVPEIALTPQTTGRLLARLPDQRVAILHSGLTSAQRHEQWRVASQAGAKVVIGARSAVFAPIPDGELGLIIVDEEHDGSYKQDQAPRYNGRDTAIRRAQLSRCPIVLGSATPSLESWHNATVRRTATLHRLPERAPGLTTPTVRIVDFREEQRQWKDKRVHLIGPTLHCALEETLAKSRQAIILLNRRGYANWVACATGAPGAGGGLGTGCQWRATCDRCDAPLVVHRLRQPADAQRSFVRCHHCLQELRLPTQCPQCRGKISIFGLGTQRVEEELSRLFPPLAEPHAMLRVDSDTMESSTDFHGALARFASGECRVLLGTQMIAKGLDFPGVALVGVISADTALHMPDFRAAERTFQLVSQVTGRCGRGNQGGTAVVQTFAPDAPAIVRAAAQDYVGFANEELAQRAAHHLPPVWRMARIVVRHPLESEAAAQADALAQRLRGAGSAARARVLGGSPCPIARINELYRSQVEVFAPDPASLSALLAEARDRDWLALGERMAVDVDPLSML